ncbi:hypothetical protein BC826DRAFT_80013 [Russula brevipes]|nr:hypothetical protein BC826DRAFT_80013 [Russula brevipes]
MAADCCCVGQATSNKLTDDALLDIFEFYLNDNPVPYKIDHLDEWHTLVHVCRRWRDLVFASPRRLNLRLLCSSERPVREMLDIWPALPIEIHDPWIGAQDPGLDNINAALETPDRVRNIVLTDIPSSIGKALAAAMQVPFPELTYLRLWSDDRSTSVLPASFLGGSAPRLHGLWLAGISFPALPNLLSSASDLVVLAIQRVPHSGYISPEGMVACLSSLNRLISLDLGFESPQSRPGQPSPPPQTRVVLPALTYLAFEGMTDYSEDFLARIDTPVLDNFSMRFFLDLVFDVPHLKQFIGRATRLKPPKAASVLVDSRSIRLELGEQPVPVLEIRCRRIDWQVDSMALVCGQLSPFCLPIEHLKLIAYDSPSEDDIESTEFLELFRPFTAVLIGPRATEVLPNLCDIFLGGSAMPGTVPEAMQPFVTARQLSGQPVAVHDWEGTVAADW